MKKFIAAVALLLLPALFAARPAQAFENFVVNGTTYSFPDVDDTDWGQNVTDWAQAVTEGTLQKTGGNFVLTAEAFFGPTYGARLAYLKGMSLVTASTGTLRFGTTDFVRWRNNSNTLDLPLGINGADQLIFNGAVLAISTGVSASTNAFAVNLFTSSHSWTGEQGFSSMSITYLNVAISSFTGNMLASTITTTGQILLTPGSLSAPAEAFSGCLTCGISLDGGTAWSIGANGRRVIQFTSSGVFTQDGNTIKTSTLTVISTGTFTSLVVTNTVVFPFLTSQSALGTDATGKLIAGSAGGGTGVLVTSVTSRGICDITIGTQGAVGANSYVTNKANWDLAIGSIGLAGLTNSATVQGTVCAGNGIYQLAGISIPSGMTLIGGASTVFQMTGVGNKIADIYGTAKDIIFDANGLAFTTYLVQQYSNSYLTGKFVGGSNGSDGSAAGYWVVQNDSSNTYTKVYARDWRDYSDVTNTAAFLISGSTNSYLELYSGPFKNSSTGNSSILANKAASGFKIKNGRWDYVADNFVLVHSNSKGEISNNEIHRNGTAGNIATIAYGHSSIPGVNISTELVIANNIIYTEGTIGGTVIGAQDNSTRRGGLRIFGNYAENIGSGSPTVFSVVTNTLGTVMWDNRCISTNQTCFSIAAGVGTQYTSKRNLVDIVEQ